jgi:hypothetical protein
MTLRNLTCGLFIFDLFLGVSPTLREIEGQIRKSIDSRVECARPVELIYPYPDKFQEWLDDIELNLKTAESLEDREHRSCFYYYLDQEIEESGLPIEGFPKVIERLEKLGLPFEYHELAGGYTYQHTLRKKVIEEFSGTVCARLAKLRILSRGDGYTISKMTVEAIRDANALLSIDSLSSEERALALLYLAEAYETEWFLYVHPDQSALAEFHTKSEQEAREKALQAYERLADIDSPLKDYALKKVESINKGEVTESCGRYNVFE